jgi:antitoxin PrlF
MPSKSYPISPAKIGSQDGFRLPKAFSHDHPHLVTAKGHIEMIDENTFLVHLEPEREARHQGGRSLESDLDDDESVMMKLFLDSLLKFAILGSRGSANAKPDSLTLYTQKMADEMDELLAGVVVDEDE